MSPKSRHILAGVGWVVGSMIAWLAVCNGFALAVTYLWMSGRFEYPTWAQWVYNVSAVGGLVLIPVAVALLAIRGRLPGTGAHRTRSRGFAVKHAGPPPDGT